MDFCIPEKLQYELDPSTESFMDKLFFLKLTDEVSEKLNCSFMVQIIKFSIGYKKML